MSVVEEEVVVDARGFDGSGLERVGREDDDDDDDAVGAVARVDRWRVSGFVGVSFFSGATVLTVLTGARIGAGAGFLDVVVAGRVGLVVGLLEALVVAASGGGSNRRTLSRDEFDSAYRPELERDDGCS